MRILFVLSFLILSIVPISSAASGEDDIIAGIVVPFFEALKAGDANAIGSYLGGNLQNRMKPLLHENQDYPSFLRERYEGARLETTTTTSEQGGALSVGLRILYSSGATECLSLVLSKDENNTWKIVEEVVSPSPC